MDDLPSACDPGSLLTRTSSDPNLNNHCQEVRVGLEPRHLHIEDMVAGNKNTVEGTPQVPEQEQKIHSLQIVSNCCSGDCQINELRTLQDDSLSSETEAESRASLGVEEGTCPAPSVFGSPAKIEEPLPNPPCSNKKDTGLESTGTWDLVEPSCQDSHQTTAGAPIWNSPTPKLGAPECQHEEDGKIGRLGHSEEGVQTGKAHPELWRKGVSQSQISEFSLLGANWDSFQGMGTSLPGSDVGPRRLLSYGCCNKRLSSRRFWASGLCLSSHWPVKEGTMPSGCSGQSGMHCISLAGRSSRLWLPCHLKQALCPKPMPPNSPSPVPPLYLDDDGLPFPTDVIQHRLRQIEATYKQEVEQLRRQVRELQLRLDIRHCYAPPAEPQMDYEDDFVSDGSGSSSIGSPCLPGIPMLPVFSFHTFVLVDY